MKIQWLGHSSFLIETSGIKILTDPFDNSIGYTTIELQDHFRDTVYNDAIEDVNEFKEYLNKQF